MEFYHSVREAKVTKQEVSAPKLGQGTRVHAHADKLSNGHHGGQVDEGVAPAADRLGPQGGGEMEVVERWLGGLDFGAYARVFEEEGFDSMRVLRVVTMEDLVGAGVKRGHALARFMLSTLSETGTSEPT